MATTRNVDAVCVTGMHRSGTSLVARIVNLLGVDFGDPDKLMRPGQDNPAGYWEHRAIKELDEAVLARHGGAWDMPPWLPPAWEIGDHLDDLRERASGILAETFASDGALIGWKDPRLALVLPFWRPLAKVVSSVVVVRDPREVAASLLDRNGFSPVRSAYLWLRYVYGAAANGANPIVVSAPISIENPGDVVERLGAHLGLSPTPAQVDEALSHVDAALRHHTAGPARPAGTDPLTALALDVWNDGDLRLDAPGDVLATALRDGWLGLPLDEREGERLQADVARLRDQLDAARRRNQELREQARTAATRYKERIERLRTSREQARRRLSSARAGDKTAAADNGTPPAERDPAG